MTNKPTKSGGGGVVDLGSPKSLANFANELKKFVVENELYSNIKGKNFVHVEGWQFAGASMGIFPVMRALENVSTDAEIKYRAEVDLVRIADGAIVGHGFAVCSNKESTKRSFDEYAIASMAQTRAVGKAFRVSVGWIMKLAGYEPTTADEAIDDNQSSVMSEAPELPIDQVKIIVDAKLSKMAAADKMRLLRDWANTISDKSLTDAQYRTLYRKVTEDAS